MSSAPLPQKIALLLVGGATLALLMPYAGCNHSIHETPESTAGESYRRDDSQPPRRGGEDRDRSTSEAEHAPLDQIEDLLSN